MATLTAKGKNQATGQVEDAAGTDNLIVGSGVTGEAEAPLVDNVAGDLFTVTLADGEMASGTAVISVHVTDGTDYQILTTICRWAAVKKGAVVIADVKSSGQDDALAPSAGTLVTVAGSNGFTVAVTATTAVFKITANTSLTPTEMHGHVFLINNHGSPITIP
jgi:hypothetical protein